MIPFLFAACASTPDAQQSLAPEVRALIGKWRERSKQLGYGSHEINVTCGGELTTAGFGERDSKNAPIRSADDGQIHLKILGIGFLEDQAKYPAYVTSDGTLVFDEIPMEKVSYPDCNPGDDGGMFAAVRQAKSDRDESQRLEPRDALTPYRSDTYPYFVVASSALHASEGWNEIEPRLRDLGLRGADHVTTAMDPQSRTRVTEIRVPGRPARGELAGFKSRIRDAFAVTDVKKTREYALAYSVKFPTDFVYGTGGNLPGFRQSDGSYEIGLGWTADRQLVFRIREGHEAVVERRVTWTGDSVRPYEGRWTSIRFGIRLVGEGTREPGLWIAVNGVHMEIDGRSVLPVPSARRAPDEIQLEVYRRGNVKGVEANDAAIRMKAFGNTGSTIDATDS